MSVFRKILNAAQGLGTAPPPPIAETANWLHAILTLADANASGLDESQSVSDEAARRLQVAGCPPFVVERVRAYARILGM
jgi:hypothetical protein